MSLKKFLKRCFRAVKSRKRFLFSLWGIRHFVSRKLQKGVADLCLSSEVCRTISHDIVLDSISFNEKEQIIREAGRVLDDYHFLFGVERKVQRGTRWNIDYKTGYTWGSGLPYFKYKIIDYSTKSDVKYAWDASRCHDLLTLGEAYLLTKDEIYAKKIVGEISSFIEENPFMQSINWTCSMDVAIRAVNWLYAIRMIINSPSFDKAFDSQVKNSLAEHCFYIEKNLEKGIPCSGNHYISDLAGLLHLYVLFGEKGKKWDFALQEFLNELDFQVLPSGVHYEKSTSYQRLVLELYLYTYLFLINNKVAIPEWAKERIVSMAHFLDELILEDGTIPLIGDNDNGRFLPFRSCDMTDYRYIVAVSANVFPNNSFINLSEGSTVDELILLGRERQQNNPIASVRSHFYEDAAFCILNKNDFKVVTHNTPMSRRIEGEGNLKYSTHTHFDLLSFTLAYKGAEIVVDPGTYCYTSNPEARLLFRSTPMHNTICVGGRDQQGSDYNNLFSAVQYSFPTTFRYEGDSVFGEYEYREKDELVYHHGRKIAIENNTCIIEDKIWIAKEQPIVSYLHLAKDISATIHGKEIIIERKNGGKVIIRYISESIDDISIDKSFISPEYGVKYEGDVIRTSLQSHTDCIECYTIISIERDEIQGY